MKKQLSVSIKGVRESAKEFVEAWRRADQGKPAEQPIERLYLEDLPTMLKVLTPGRLEVLQVLHQAGAVWKDETRLQERAPRPSGPGARRPSYAISRG